MEGQQQQVQQQQPVVSASDAAPPAISSVSLKLPPYWPNDPTLWFTQVEAQFTTRHIMVDATKYAYLMGSLQPEIAQEVRDLLLHLPQDIQLKEALIKWTSDSDQKRLRQLLTAEELGDRKPSQLYRRMLQLLGDRTLEPTIMKRLFLSHLPANVQLILASAKDEPDMPGLTTLADKILEVSATSPISVPPPTVSSVHPEELPSQSATIHTLQLQIQQLTQKFESWQADQRSRPRSGSRNRSRSYGRNRSSSRNRSS
ncbi:uncharacterized protein LOC117122750 [Anneissia japonica]|uniref:uncharacterized protein LOC117122750 n=1 Tax=Anneissia japonica TaxID=1529436 RepID=UPI001425AB9D|nr:uncharacterized protein LOC117122750 [Anneissia japonica]